MSKIIADLPAVSTPDDTDKVWVENSGVDRYATRAQITAAVKAIIDAHLVDLANPHTVTKTQVSLGNLTDDAQAKIASNLSDLADVNSARENIGVKQYYTWQIAGTLTVGTEQGGAFVAPRALTIEKAYIYCKTTGTVSGSTIVDINKNGASVFTTQSNRPTLAYDDSDKKAVTPAPNVVGLVEGDIVTLDIDAIPGGNDSADLTVLLICK